MDNKKKESNLVDNYRSKYKKRRGFQGYKPENVTPTTTQSESMHVQDGEEPDVSLSSVGKTEKECVVEDKIVPTGPSISCVVSRKMKRDSVLISTLWGTKIANQRKCKQKKRDE